MEILSHYDFETSFDKDVILKKCQKCINESASSKNDLALGLQYNREILSSDSLNHSIRFLNDIVGNSLFTEELIKKEQYIGKYTGTIRKNDRRYGYPLNNYCYEYPVPDETGINYVIDGTNGNYTRFINHSNSPNIKPFYAFTEGLYHVIFLAIQDIPKGSQLFFDYGKTYWYIRGTPQVL